MLPEVIEIKMTDSDIKQGKVGDCYECPVARAVHRVYPNSRPFVCNDSILINDDDGCRHGYMPDNHTQDYIFRFDVEGIPLPANHIIKLTSVVKFPVYIDEHWAKKEGKP